MRLNRRRLLVLGGLTGLGVFSLVKGWLHNGGVASSPKLNSAQLQPPSPPESSNVADGSQAVTANPLLRFVAIADTGAADDNQYAVADAMTRYCQQHPYNLVLLAGDNIYNNGEIWKIGEVFEQPYKSLLTRGVTFRACLGNHDIRTENGDPQVKYAGFNMPQRYYTFREKTVQFFALDTNVNADWKAQLTWLDQELRRSDAPWKIVFGHHPIYSSGAYGSNPAFIDALTPLFKKYGVQLYINGHEHSYERTRPINGTTYLITGIGGAYLRPVGQSEWTDYSVSQYGFTVLEVYGDRIDVRGIATNNQVFDRGTIQL
ncbi:MAG: metallophosphoesterase [Leptolyngbyaceae cyanobacterium RU_5_1]|nr:metallophosphoesterase [Leptolyngbyaceae cyanobacterium RU_5_1]